MSIVTDEENFIERLNTFHVDTWFAKPSALAPEICASFGWSNVGPDKLECLTCKATLQYTASRDVLEIEPEETVTPFLQNLEWEHDAECIWCEHQCPVEFRRLRIDDPQHLFSDVVTRFRRLSAMWDLPKLDFSLPDQETALASKLQRLQDKLHKEGEAALPSTVTDPWQRRGRVLTVLSLLGWELKVLDYPIGQDTTTDISDLVQRKTAMRPEATGYCLARQSVLHCRRCTASLGLWSFATVPEVPLETFREVAKANIEHGLHIVISAETGEVEDLFQRFYEAEGTEGNASTPVQAVEETRDETSSLKRSLSLDLEDNASHPVFGLQCLKKKRVSSLTATVEPSPSFLTGPVLSGPELNPLEEHRSFCVYRSQWQSVLEAVLHQEDL